MINSNAPAEKQSFAELLEQSLTGKKGFEGSVVKGIVVDIRNDQAIIDVGLKAEGRLALRDMGSLGHPTEIKVGDMIDVYVERMEDKNGEAVLSIEKARREAAWTVLEQSYQDNQDVQGFISSRVRGGFAVNLQGAIAFLPGSQLDIRPISDPSVLMNTDQLFKILKMDKARGNIVVSRRAVLEKGRDAARSELVAGLVENQILDGIVKNITDYGAFVDLGGVDGLLHVTDIAWKRISHPSDVLKVGQSVRVKVIRVNSENQRISLGMKQLDADPWSGVEQRYVVGSRYQGRVTNVADYGAFVELEPAVEGLIHVTEMSWTKKNIHPSRILTPNQDIEVMILDVDTIKRRISLGLKQCSENPWEHFAQTFPAGSVLEGEIKNITEFGLFVGVSEFLDGMVHQSDVAWEDSEKVMESFKKGDRVEVKVLDVDPLKERISLGMKQLAQSFVDPSTISFKKGDVVTGTVCRVDDKEIDVELEGGVIGSIRKADLSTDRDAQRTERFSVGEKVDAKVISVDRYGSKISLSIKALERDEEQKAISEYGSTDSGASLGDILGEALAKAAASNQKLSG